MMVDHSVIRNIFFLALLFDFMLDLASGTPDPFGPGKNMHVLILGFWEGVKPYFCTLPNVMVTKNAYFHSSLL